MHRSHKTTSGRRRTDRAAVIVGCLLLGLSFVSQSTLAAEHNPRQPVPATFYGIYPLAIWRLPIDQWDAQLDKVAATGVGVARFLTRGGTGFEPSPPTNGVHHYDWTSLDREVAALARHNLRGLPFLFRSPKWAAANSASAPPALSPPDPLAFAAFAQAFAARYGRNGSFWAANAGLPARPITQYEIWNEQNSELYFQGTDPAMYATLYAGARAAIHAVDLRATVLVGGLVPTLQASSWLRAFIAELPAHGHEIDALGWHPYYPTPAAVYASVRSLRRTLTSGQLDPPIVLTEVNDTDGAYSPFLLAELARTLPRSDCHVTGMVVYTWSPSPPPYSPDPYSIADPFGNLNSVGLAYASALQTAQTRGVRKPPRICEASKFINGATLRAP